eukprot:Hpha_TRINITY_DN16922_c0_g6::TRINITY_DN16922_c0_g6_i1::g.56117::m.56117
MERLNATIEEEKAQRLDAAKLLKVLTEDKAVSSADGVTMAYVADVCEALFAMRAPEASSWEGAVRDICKAGEIPAVAKRLMSMLQAVEEEEEAGADELCNCQF